MTAPAPPVPLGDAALWRVLTPLATDQWPIDKLMTLIRLWEAGTPRLAIEERLRVSKGSVLGKIHRLAGCNIVTLRPNPAAVAADSSPERDRERSLERARRLKSRMDVPSFPQPPPAPPPAPVVAYAAPYLGRVSDCCWPIGKPGSREFHFCDKPTDPGKPYCHRHVQVAYQKSRPADVHTQISAPGRMAHVGRSR